MKNTIFVPFNVFLSGLVNSFQPGMILSCSRHLATSADLFGCHALGPWGGGYWRVGGPDQGYCYTSCNAQDSPPPHRISQPQMSVVLSVRNPVPG